MTQSKEKFDYKEWAKKTGYFKKYYAEHKCDYQERKKRYECSQKGIKTRRIYERQPERLEAKRIQESNRRIAVKMAKDIEAVKLTMIYQSLLHRKKIKEAKKNGT